MHQVAASLETRFWPKVYYACALRGIICGCNWIKDYLTNKEASTMLCSVVKHLGSGRALKKWGKTLDARRKR